MNSEIENTQPIINDIKPKKKYDMKKYNYDMKKYTDAFFERHKGEKFTCEICLKSVSIFNKSHHNKSKYHLGVLNILELKNLK
jgi:hypothetical protein